MTRRVGRLHVIVDTLDLARAALDGGADVVQVRLKDGTDRERFGRLVPVARLCADRGALCVVNDRVDMAVAAGAGGVHVGDDDLPVEAVRAVAGPGVVVGATARDAAGAARLARAGADYLGVGPCYATATKVGLPAAIGPAGLAAVAAAVDVPVVAIAGVTAGRVPELLAAGAWGVAVVGAVAGAPDPRAATARLAAALGRAA